MKTFLFFIVVLIGIILRFYQLGNVPNSLNWDEVSWGYNAYTILETGKDEYGIKYPLSFQALGDYKQPMYVYLDVVPIKVFGFTPFAVRFPSAVFGSLSIFLVYFLVYELFKKERYRGKLAFLSMFFFAISPWSIQFSRIGYEANIGLFFILCASLLFIKGLRSKSILYCYFSLIPFTLSAYTYHSEKIFAPLLFFGMFIYGSRFFKEKKLLFVGLILVFLIGNLPWIIDARTTARGRGVLFTIDQTEILKPSAKELIQDKNNHDKTGEVFHNRRLVYATHYVSNYFKHFDLNFLFIAGDNPRHHAPEMGILYIVSLPFIIIGALYLFKTTGTYYWIVFYWLLTAPIASGFAIDAPNASRSLVFLPIWQIFEGLGLMLVFRKIFLLKFFYITAVLLVTLFSFNCLYFIHQYFIHMNTNRDFGFYWQYGYKEAVRYARTNSDKRVFFVEDIEQPYIFYLFYNKYDPKKYLNEGGSNRKRTCYTIDNVFFGSCSDKLKIGDIYITGRKKIKETAFYTSKEVSNIGYEGNSEIAIRIYEVVAYSKRVNNVNENF